MDSEREGANNNILGHGGVGVGRGDGLTVGGLGDVCVVETSVER